MKFTIHHTDPGSNARCATLQTDHGPIQTPVFMPVGTQATVKTLNQEQLEAKVDARIILGNAYHLYLRPGLDTMQAAGGLHKFMNWNRALLTDSGGYQVFSLAQRRKITEEGVRFQSHIDGSRHMLSPESAIDIQRKIGADIIMAFDECTPYPCERKYATDSMLLTHRWLDRCAVAMANTEPLYGHQQSLFPIVQGSTYPDLRARSAEYIAAKGFDGNAIGGLSVGEPHDLMYAMTDAVTAILPVDKPRYLMGVGTPRNLLECIGFGIDMFDCVMPSRNARNGQLFTMSGVINLKNAKWIREFTPPDEDGVLAKAGYSLAYLRHLFIAGETLGLQLASLHNLEFYARLMQAARRHIEAGDFASWKDAVGPKLEERR